MRGVCRVQQMLFLGFLAFAHSGEAKLFRNSYVSFELPSNWECQLESTEWVCRSQFNDQAKEAIIILTAKETGPMDTFAEYEKHLKTPRTIVVGPGQTSASVIQHVKQDKINNHTWVDGWHLSSEIPKYYTRYLATVKKRIAILVTFSAHRAHYTKYSQDFFRAIKSLRVIANASLLENPVKSQARGSGETFGAPVGTALPGDILASDALPREADGDSSTTTKVLGLGLLLAAAGLYFLLQRKGK